MDHKHGFADTSDDSSTSQTLGTDKAMDHTYSVANISDDNSTSQTLGTDEATDHEYGVVIKLEPDEATDHKCDVVIKLEPDQGRFATLDDNDLKMLLDGRLSANTKHTINTSLSTFHEYVRSKGKTMAEIEELTPDKLDTFIGRFFAEVRKTDGSLYATKSLLALRYGLAQHIKKTHGFNIMSSPEFASSREIFAAAIVQLKQAGRGSVIHKEPLTTEDFNKLYSSDVLSTSNPVGLQNKVFVDFMIQLCNRGRENLREMTRDDFIVSVDSAGHRYACIKDKQTKNHSASSEISQGGHMYEAPGSERCPLAALEKYLAKLNRACMAFWQKPKRNSNESDTCWYDDVPIGKNSLYEKMKDLSISAKLSNVYTNHCLRATSVTALHQHGYEAKPIMTVSGEKSESPNRAYSRKATDTKNVTDTKKREMSLALSSHTAVLQRQNDSPQIMQQATQPLIIFTNCIVHNYCTQ